MRLHSPFLFALLFTSFFIPPTRSLACGYNWVSACATQVYLRINGTLDSFLIDPCPSGYPFNGIYLGELQHISLANAKAITWESCQNNVSGVRLAYRLYEQTTPAGPWFSQSLEQYKVVVDGAYTTRYRQMTQELILDDGLVVGQTYTLEVYMVAEIDTLGDDFVPEAELVKNNGGQNYRLSFTYGGAGASPILLLPHLTQPRCYGNHDGSISVGVYGDQNGIFYHWSNTSTNFPAQYNIPAGVYGLTVTNAAGHNVSTSITLTQPAPLQPGFSGVQSVGCQNSPGFAIAYAEGGTPPYLFTWSDGQSGANASFPEGGIYNLTVTDSQQCSESASLNIMENDTVIQPMTAAICAGETYQLGNQTLDQSGNYQMFIPGSGGGCDTLIILNLNVYDPGASLSVLPASLALTCQVPTANLCVNELPNAQYTWRWNDLPVGAQACLTVQNAGFYQITVKIGHCTATRFLTVYNNQVIPQATAYADIGITCHPTLQVLFFTNNTTQQNTFAWHFQGNLISNNDSVWITIPNPPPPPNATDAWPTLIVTNPQGCSSTQTTYSILYYPDNDWPAVTIQTQGATNNNTADGTVTITNIFNATGPYSVHWNTGASDWTIDSLLPGVYCVTVTAANGCTTSRCVSVSATTASPEIANLPPLAYPNPAQAGEIITLRLPRFEASEEVKIEIFDPTGRVTRRFKADNIFEGLLQCLIPPDIPSGWITLGIQSSGISYRLPLLIE